MKKLIFLTLIFTIIVSIWLGALYLSRVFIPEKLTPLLSEKLSDYLQKRVEFDPIEYKLFQGFKVKNMRIFEGPLETDELLIKVKEVRFNIQFLSIWRLKKVVIPSVCIDSPMVYVNYKGDRTFDTFWPKPAKPKPSQKTGLSLLVKRIVLKNGECLIEDQTKEPYFRRRIIDLNADSTISLPGSLKLTCRGVVQNNNLHKSRLFLKGKYNSLDNSFEAEAIFKDIPLDEYEPYFAKVDLSLAKAQIKEFKTLISGNDDRINSQYSFAAEEVVFVKDDFKVRGALSSEGNIKVNLSNKAFDYSGYADISRGYAQGIPGVGVAENIEGRVGFSKDILTIPRLTAKVLDCPVEISGELRQFANPSIEASLSGPNLEVNTKLGLGAKKINIAYLDSEIFNTKFGVKGSIGLEEIKKPFLDLEGSLSLALEDIRKISARVGRSLDFPDLEGNFSASFLMSGFWPDKGSLNIDLDGKSKRLLLRDLALTDFSLQYNQEQSQAAVKLFSKAYQGVLNISSNLDYREADIAHSTQIKLRHLDLASLKKDTAWRDKNTSGIVNLTGSLDGRLKDLASLGGNCRLEIKNGNLWEWEPLSGLGKLILPADFSKIVFEEARGVFLIEQSKVNTENFKFTSDNLQLVVDGYFDFAGNTNFTIISQRRKKPPKRQFMGLGEVISPILNQAQRYILVKMSGTFKKPRYKILPQTENLLKDLLDVDDLFDVLEKSF